jgi:TetR/AcrR family transcriptional regulator, mexCD-oprJ operon repressor
MPEPATDHRREIAERNIEAILDGAERQLGRGAQASISAVAEEAGVSRVTVYAHFPDRERLIEALVERAVRRATKAVEAAEPDRGPAIDALGRVIEASWEELGRHEEIARAAAAELSSDAMRRTHEAGRRLLRRLVMRGRRQGEFRTDVGTDWLVTSFFALVHAARDEVRSGELQPSQALKPLQVTLTDLFVGGATSAKYP